MRGAPLATDEEVTLVRKQRYEWALNFCRIVITDDEEISMTNPNVLEASSRFRLSPPQVRRLVGELRKERDERA